MYIIKMTKKTFTISLLIVFAISSTFLIFKHLQNFDPEKRFNLVCCNNSCTFNLALISYIASNTYEVNANKDIELFDIAKGSVIKKIKSDIQVQKEVFMYLNSITGMYPKVNALPNSGYIIRIPLDNSYKIKNFWIDSFIDEIFIIFKTGSTPYLLLLDDKKRPLFLNFNKKTTNLLNLLKIESLLSPYS